MSTIDGRIIRVSVEIDGKFQVYEARGFTGFNITARGQKTANPLQNTCDVVITNLKAETRNYLLTETSPFNKNRRPKRLIVEAGRESVGVSRLFYGEITSASPSQPPDIGLTLKAQTGSFSKGKILARSGTAMQSLKSLAALVAKDLGVTLNFQATDKTIANYAFSGAALRQVDALGAAGGVDAFVDDQVLVIKDRGVSLVGRVRKLSADTGMVGIPEVTEHGVNVTFLLDQTTVIGGALELESKLNPAVNGSYSIYGLNFDIASRAEQFYWIADARRPVYGKTK